MQLERLESKIQYVADQKGNLTGVIVPLEIWEEITSDLETAYLLQSEAMKRRLLEAIQREEGIPLDDALARLGI
jgi:hypothetical protein